jgi:hypothetical protein
MGYILGLLGQGWVLATNAIATGIGIGIGIGRQGRLAW